MEEIKTRDFDEGEKIIVKAPVGNKVPLEGQLPAPDDRLYYNGKVAKPIRKLTELKVSFGKLTVQNVEQFRILNYLTLPVVYSEDFYDRLTNYSRYSTMAYYKDVLCGAISCRYEDDKENKNKARVVYIMTITVLKAYRRYGIGRQMLNQAIEECKAADVSRIYLHVLCSNESAIEFYRAAGFNIKEKLMDYYTDLDPPHCYVLEKDISIKEEDGKKK